MTSGLPGQLSTTSGGAQGREAKQRQRKAGRFEGKNEDGTLKVKDVQVPEPARAAETVDDRHNREAVSRAGKMFRLGNRFHKLKTHFSRQTVVRWRAHPLAKFRTYP